MHTKIYSATTIGVETHIVDVEVDLSYGMLQFFIVGLPDTAIKESKQRIQTALKNCGLKLPERKITVNLAPADLKKEGTLFDLPIAIGILKAAQLIPIDNDFLSETIFLGELSLDGSIKPIKGALAVACDAKKLNKKRIIIPEANTQEASLIYETEVFGFSHLNELVSFLRKETTKKACEPQDHNSKNETYDCDFSQVKGQVIAKRALKIAAAGNHHIIFIGPPGSGKTMLAKRLATILPNISFQEKIQTSKVYSISGKLNGEQLISRRPFRNPHHTISQAGLVGGGSFPQPGEVSLAHNGVLFLDELTEFKRSTIEVLRQPLESKEVTISRAQHTITFPASFLLVAALNPCPCGYFGDKNKNCSCTQKEIKNYLEKLSGPILDRIDLQIHVPAIDYQTIKTKEVINETSQIIKEAVQQTANMQKDRFQKEGYFNSMMSPDEIDKWCTTTKEAEELIKIAFNKLNLSMRGYHKILKVSRTIADLENSKDINSSHVKEALFYRSIDRYFESQ